MMKLSVHFLPLTHPDVHECLHNNGNEDVENDEDHNDCEGPPEDKSRGQIPSLQLEQIIKYTIISQHGGEAGH